MAHAGPQLAHLISPHHQWRWLARRKMDLGAFPEHPVCLSNQPLKLSMTVPHHSVKRVLSWGRKAWVRVLAPSHPTEAWARHALSLCLGFFTSALLISGLLWGSNENIHSSCTWCHHCTMTWGFPEGDQSSGEDCQCMQCRSPHQVRQWAAKCWARVSCWRAHYHSWDVTLKW